MLGNLSIRRYAKNLPSNSTTKNIGQSDHCQQCQQHHYRTQAPLITEISWRFDHLSRVFGGFCNWIFFTSHLWEKNLEKPRNQPELPVIPLKTNSWKNRFVVDQITSKWSSFKEKYIQYGKKSNEIGHCQHVQRGVFHFILFGPCLWHDAQETPERGKVKRFDILSIDQNLALTSLAKPTEANCAMQKMLCQNLTAEEFFWEFWDWKIFNVVFCIHLYAESKVKIQICYSTVIQTKTELKIFWPLKERSV